MSSTRSALTRAASPSMLPTTSMSAGCGSDHLDVFDQAHALIGSWSGADMTLVAPPEFGPDGEILGLDRDGGIVKLKVAPAPG